MGKVIWERFSIVPGRRWHEMQVRGSRGLRRKIARARLLSFTTSKILTLLRRTQFSSIIIFKIVPGTLLALNKYCPF